MLQTNTEREKIEKETQTHTEQRIYNARKRDLHMDRQTRLLHIILTDIKSET